MLELQHHLEANQNKQTDEQIKKKPKEEREEKNVIPV